MESKVLPLIQPAREQPLPQALSEAVVFHSPVRDYHGRADVVHILATIGDVLDKIEFQRELVGECHVVTIVSASHQDREMTGVLDETYDAVGRLEHATLLLRPLSALLDAIAAMRAALEQSPLPSSHGRLT